MIRSTSSTGPASARTNEALTNGQRRRDVHDQMGVREVSPRSTGSRAVAPGTHTATEWFKPDAVPALVQSASTGLHAAWS